MSENSFADMVLSKVPATTVTFPVVTYDPDGDCIEFLVSNESFYARRIDSLTAIYYSQEPNEIVGSLLKGVRKFLHEGLRQAPGFRVEIVDGRVRLQHLFTLRLWSERRQLSEPEVFVYRVLREKAEKTGAEVELGGLAAV
jgi:hypothetical protein